MVKDESRIVRDGNSIACCHKSFRIPLKVAGKLKQFSVRIVGNSPKFESDFCLMRTTYWTTLLACDGRSLVLYILVFATKLLISFFFSPHARTRVKN